MKTHTMRLASFIASFLISAGANAQFVTDVTTYQNLPNDQLINQCIYRDDANGVYQVVQTTSALHNGLLISQTDQDFNISSTTAYLSMNSNLHLTPYDIDELPGSGAGGVDQLIIVGKYIDEGTGDGAFMMSVNKNTGAFNWYHEYPGIYILNACVAFSNAAGGGIIAVGMRNATNPIYPITGQSGVIVAANSSGNLQWRKEIESGKYMSSNLNLGNGEVMNWLYDVVKIDDEHFAACGFLNSFDYNIYPYYDADGALVLFDNQGNISDKYGLGNPIPLNFGGTQPLRYEMLETLVYDGNDNTVVMTGFVFESPVTEPMPSCPGPDRWGLWSTKLDLSSFNYTWSNLYDFSGNPPGVGAILYGITEIHSVFDPNGNYGIIYTNPYDVTTPGVATTVIMKTEPTVGATQYSRRYSYQGDVGIFRHMTTAFNGVPDIAAVGSLHYTNSTSDGYGVVAFDNIVNYCESDEFPVNEENKDYELFDIDEQTFQTNVNSQIFDLVPQTINNNIVCDRIAQKPGRDNNDKDLISIGYARDNNTIVVSSGNNKNWKGVLVNNLGQTIRTFDNITGTQKIDISGLIPGVYYFQVSDGKNRKSTVIPVQ
jgi:hypothetical protein